MHNSAMASTCRPIQSFYMVMGLSKNVAYHGWPTTQNKKKHWLKHPEAEKGNLTKIYIIQNLIFGIRFLKILFPLYNFIIFVHTFQWTTSEFFLISDFPAGCLKVNKN